MEKIETQIPASANPYIEFQDAYEHHDFDAAADIFINALNADPGNAFRQFFIQGSGQLAEVCNRNRRNAEILARLDQLLHEHPHAHYICNNTPEEVARIARLREGHIDKGLPSIVLVTQGKSGSMTVGNIFNSGYHLPSIAYSFGHWKIIESWAADYARGGACHWTHLQADVEQIRRLRKAGIHKIIVHVRDPRQTLVSVTHHLTMYPEQLGRLRDTSAGGNTISEKALSIIPYYQTTIRWIEKWVAMESEIAILFSTFERMVSDWDRLVDSYVDFYGGYTKYFTKEHAGTRHDGLDYHFRQGRTDEWREVFSPEDADRLSAMLPQKLKDRFGWPD